MFFSILKKYLKSKLNKSMECIPLDSSDGNAKTLDILYAKGMSGVFNLIDIFEINPYKIESDEHANSIICTLLDLSTDIKMKSEDQEITFKSIKKIMILVNKKECRSRNDRFRCKRVILEKTVCRDCFNKAYYMDTDYNDYCPQCKIKENKARVEKSEKEFCSVCLQLRILHTYNALINFVKHMKFTIKQIENVREFVTAYVSILIYETERIKYGYGYFNQE